jgi:predicted ATP-binding protein involved in virulence
MINGNILMKIDKLKLKNFRCFKNIKIEFSPHFNLIIGDNASGKTALLRGGCVAISSFFLGIDEVPNRPIQKNDIRLANYENGIEYCFPVEANCWGTIGSEKLEWSRQLTGRKARTKLQNTEIKSIAKRYQQQVSEGHCVDLPVIAYFSAKRIWEPPEKMNLVEKGSRLRGYHNAIAPALNYKFFTEWFKTKEMAFLQNKTRNFELQVVKKAVSQCIGQCEDIYYDIDIGALVMKFFDGKIIPFNRLSDGIRNIMAIVADIAYRCVTLNPHLKEKSLENDGVVLIDELDLHLHPSWQKKIVVDLKKIFPNIQFIAATHSPLILSTLTNEDRIIALEADKLEYVEKLYGRDVNDILSYPMNTPFRNQDLEEYFELIEMGEGKSKKAIKLREKIEKESGADYHELARADVLLTFFEEE